MFAEASNSPSDGSASSEPTRIDKPILQIDAPDPIKKLTLGRLKYADPGLFGDSRYAMRLQANCFKQPMVITMALYQEKRQALTQRQNEITAELGTNPDQPVLVQEQADIGYQQTIYDRGVEYRGNYYFCPEAYEFETERILVPSEIIQARENKPARDPKTGNLIYMIDQRGLRFPYAGFCELRPGLYAVGAYAKPNTRFKEALLVR